MKIVVDSNIVFSAILNSQSKIGQLLINGSKYFDFFSIGLLKNEIFEHRNKILSVSGFSIQQFEKSLLFITNRIKFVDEIILSDNVISEALELVSEIDENDALFVALTNHLNAKLWTGDKKLILGLKKKGYKQTISTEKLNKLFIEKQLRYRRK